MIKINRIVTIAALLTLGWLAPAWATEERQAYREITPTEFEQRFTVSDYDPKRLGLELFQVLTVEREGRRSEELAVEYQRGDEQFGAIVTITVEGLADDSVAAQRLKLDLFYDAELGWQLDWVGQQVRCWPGRGSQDWTAEKCS